MTPLEEILGDLPPPGARVAVGLSGGVDSSMAAWLLTRRGCEVVALTMSVWDRALPLPDRGLSGCFGPGEERDIASARATAAALGIEHRVVGLAGEYRETVLEYFRQEYLAGRTPNPCVRCNRAMKFGLLLERAHAAGIAFDYFATGHYARVADDAISGRRVLQRGLDPAKDQSYFLAMLRPEQLRPLALPLGRLRKTEVKALARAAGFESHAERPESQDFIECEDYGVLFRPGELRPGDITDEAGRVLGRHEGLVRYTIGQRKGLGIGGGGEPHYVVGLDAARNRVIVGRRESLRRRALRATGCNWIALPSAPEAPIPCVARIRFRHEGAPATIVRDPEAPDAVRVEFDAPQLSITPGQTAVFYRDDIVLGAGAISEAIG